MNDSAADFQTEDDTAEPTSVIPVLAEPKRKKEKKGKKRKAAESVEDDDEGEIPILFAVNVFLTIHNLQTDL